MATAKLTAVLLLVLLVECFALPHPTLETSDKIIEKADENNAKSDASADLAVSGSESTNNNKDEDVPTSRNTVEEEGDEGEGEEASNEMDDAEEKESMVEDERDAEEKESMVEDETDAEEKESMTQDETDTEEKESMVQENDASMSGDEAMNNEAQTEAQTENEINTSAQSKQVEDDLTSVSGGSSDVTESKQESFTMSEDGDVGETVVEMSISDFNLKFKQAEQNSEGYKNPEPSPVYVHKTESESMNKIDDDITKSINSIAEVESPSNLLENDAGQLNGVESFKSDIDSSAISSSVANNNAGLGQERKSLSALISDVSTKPIAVNNIAPTINVPVDEEIRSLSSLISNSRFKLDETQVADAFTNANTQAVVILPNEAEGVAEPGLVIFRPDSPANQQKSTLSALVQGQIADMKEMANPEVKNGLNVIENFLQNLDEMIVKHSDNTNGVKTKQIDNIQEFDGSNSVSGLENHSKDIDSPIEQLSLVDKLRMPTANSIADVDVTGLEKITDFDMESSGKDINDNINEFATTSTIMLNNNAGDVLEDSTVPLLESTISDGETQIGKISRVILNMNILPHKSQNIHVMEPLQPSALSPTAVIDLEDDLNINNAPDASFADNLEKDLLSQSIIPDVIPLQEVNESPIISSQPDIVSPIEKSLEPEENVISLVSQSNILSTGVAPSLLPTVDISEVEFGSGSDIAVAGPKEISGIIENEDIINLRSGNNPVEITPLAKDVDDISISIPTNVKPAHGRPSQGRTINLQKHLRNTPFHLKNLRQFSKALEETVAENTFRNIMPARRFLSLRGHNPSQQINIGTSKNIPNSQFGGQVISLRTPKPSQIYNSDFGKNIPTPRQETPRQIFGFGRGKTIPIPVQETPRQIFRGQSGGATNGRQLVHAPTHSQAAPNGRQLAQRPSHSHAAPLLGRTTLNPNTHSNKKIPRRKKQQKVAKASSVSQSSKFSLPKSLIDNDQVIRSGRFLIVPKSFVKNLPLREKSLDSISTLSLSDAKQLVNKLIRNES